MCSLMEHSDRSYREEIARQEAEYAQRMSKALDEAAAAIRGAAKAMGLLGKQAEILHRDFIRASRQPALIHNGKKPR